MTDSAFRVQNRAAHPAMSTWLTANAGSGKTRVLTDRVARLLLNGVEPQNILCLTYTKAAASEMQNRLFRTLGRWTMLDEPELRTELTALDEDLPDDLAHARTLFASAIEAPGGLKIQTIHSFCSKILRQFPLESGVNPQFREMDDLAQRNLLKDVVDDIATDDPRLLADIRRAYSGESLTDLARDIARNAEGFEPARTQDEIFSIFYVPPGQSVEAIVENTISEGDIAFLKSLVPILNELGGTNDGKLADALAELDDQPSPEVLSELEDRLLTKDGTKPPFQVKRDIPTKTVREGAAFAPLLEQFIDIGERVEAARRARLDLEAAENALALEAFAKAVLPRYAAVKASVGVLDFDDLIRRTRTLLTTRSLEWVLYRLDGSIDHVLLDEAQDTSPAQWDVIEALTAEMVSSESDRNRTLFVVGDKKQSIYSFQGADAAGFDRRAEAFREQLAGGDGLKTLQLLHSFRSSPAILNMVDAVFSTPSGAGDPTKHLAFHDAMPGRVDLWPLIPKSEKEDALPWHDLSARTVETDASVQLANKVAREITQLLKTGTIQGKNGEWRRIEPGDIMVLVQRRSTLFDQIIAACKARNLDIAGADRLKVGSELAVRDVLALLSFLALPEDDLSLAAALRSPLIGWSEQDLFDLAARRADRSYLWQALRDRRADFADTFEKLTELRSKVDFLRPFELIDLILTAHGGRMRLLKRLGPEVEDGLDELLNQALSYEHSNVPSLTGFLAFARASDIEIRREAESGGNLIRVMTVHGAKGLESPIVILPDTTFSRPRTGQDIIEGPGGVPVLPLGKAKSPEKMLGIKAAYQNKDEEERDRLLYVAMTRAERWLILCGIAPSRNSGDKLNWHKKAEAGLIALGASHFETPSGTGLRYELGSWPDRIDPPASETKTTVQQIQIPEPEPPKPVPRVAPLSPSALGGSKALAQEPGAESGGARKGRQLHRLLEHLPGSSNPLGTAHSLLERGPDAASEDEIAALLAEAKSIIDTHADVFGKEGLAEVEIVADVPALGGRISGAIDRLSVTADRIVAVDFKTNAVVPDTPENTPEGLLRQMGAYLEALEAIYPDRSVEVAILWTATGTLMPLPHGIVRAALHQATTS